MQPNKQIWSLVKRIRFTPTIKNGIPLRWTLLNNAYISNFVAFTKYSSSVNSVMTPNPYFTNSIKWTYVQDTVNSVQNCENLALFRKKIGKDHLTVYILCILAVTGSLIPNLFFHVFKLAVYTYIPLNTKPYSSSSSIYATHLNKIKNLKIILHFPNSFQLLNLTNCHCYKGYKYQHPLLSPISNYQLLTYFDYPISQSLHSASVQHDTANDAGGNDEKEKVTTNLNRKKI